MKTEKTEIAVAYLLEQTKYVIHRRNLKQALNQELVLKRIHIMIKFNWLKPYIDLNTDQRKKSKNDFKTLLLKLINNLNKILENKIENVRKHRDITLVTTAWRRSYLISRTNYHCKVQRTYISNENEEKQRYLWVKMCI